MWFIARHQLLTGFLKNLSPFLVDTPPVHQYSWVCMLQPPSSNPTRDFLRGSSQVTATVLMRSLSCWKVQWHPRFSFLTDSMKLSPTMSWYLNEFIFLSTLCRFLLPEETNQPQSITEPPPPPGFTVDRLFFSAYASFFFFLLLLP